MYVCVVEVWVAKFCPKRNNVVMYVKLQDFGGERLAFKIVAFPGKLGGRLRIGFCGHSIYSRFGMRFQDDITRATRSIIVKATQQSLSLKP